MDDPNVCDKFGLPALWFAVRRTHQHACVFHATCVGVGALWGECEGSSIPLTGFGFVGCGSVPLSPNRPPACPFTNLPTHTGGTRTGGLCAAAAGRWGARRGLGVCHARRHGGRGGGCAVALRSGGGARGGGAGGSSGGGRPPAGACACRAVPLFPAYTTQCRRHCTCYGISVTHEPTPLLTVSLSFLPWLSGCGWLLVSESRGGGGRPGGGAAAAGGGGLPLHSSTGRRSRGRRRRRPGRRRQRRWRRRGSSSRRRRRRHGVPHRY